MSGRVGFGFVLCLLVMVGAGCGDSDDESAACPEGGCTVVKELDVEYNDRELDREFVDVYAPAESGEWPVVVLTHGKTLSRSTLAALADELGSQGAVVYAVGYRDDDPLEAVQDVSCAIRFATSTASEHGGDPERVVVAGHSLGGAVGFLAATSGEDHAPSGCRGSDEWVDVVGFVGYESPYDIASTARAIDITGLEENDPELWHSLNPYSQIGRNEDLRVRLVHGIDEGGQWYDLAPDISEDFERALSEAGYDVELITVDGASHGGWSPTDSGFDAIVAATMELAGA